MSERASKTGGRHLLDGGPTLEWQIFLEASTIYSSFSGHDDRPFDCDAIKQTDGMNIAAFSTASRQPGSTWRVERSGRRRERRGANYSFQTVLEQRVHCLIPLNKTTLLLLVPREKTNCLPSLFTSYE